MDKTTPKAKKAHDYLVGIGMNPKLVVIHEYTNPYSYLEIDRDFGTQTWREWPDEFDWQTFRQAYDDDVIAEMEALIALKPLSATPVLPEMYTDLDGVMFRTPRNYGPMAERYEIKAAKR